MGSAVRAIFNSFFGIEPENRQKVFFLSITFFLVIAAYTLSRELKSSIFISVVGKSYQPWARGMAMFVLMPAILLYSRLVDKLRRYQLIAYYSFAFGIVGLIFAYFIGHPTIGILNTDTNPNRIFGWLFYFFVEGFSPFIVSVFWAFANSVTSPEGAKRNYGIMVAVSKFGGILAALFGWFFLASRVTGSIDLANDAFNHQVILVVSSLMLLGVSVAVHCMMRMVPGRYLHGYEAAYQAEKQKSKEGSDKTGILSGLIMLIRYPYVLGIFGMVFFYEVVSTVLGYMRLGVAQAGSSSVSEVTIFLLKTALMTHLVGFFISLIGTRALLKKLGERVCLLLIPAAVGALLLYFMVKGTPEAFIVAFVALQAVNYAFSWPVRESLYIPTVKTIKFKSKSWIDAFGNKFARSSGSLFNIVAAQLGSSFVLPLHSFFFALIVSSWFVTAFFLGKRFEWAVNNNEVIGLDDQE